MSEQKACSNFVALAHLFSSLCVRAGRTGQVCDSEGTESWRKERKGGALRSRFSFLLLWRRCKPLATWLPPKKEGLTQAPPPLLPPPLPPLAFHAEGPYGELYPPCIDFSFERENEGAERKRGREGEREIFCLLARRRRSEEFLFLGRGETSFHFFSLSRESILLSSASSNPTPLASSARPQLAQRTRANGNN